MSGTHEDLASDIRVYAGLASNLESFDEDLDVTAALIRRDRIERALKLGVTPTDESLERLAHADDELRKSSTLLASRFPWLFGGDHPREHWWWHLATSSEARTA